MIVIYREILLLNIVILFTVFFIKGDNSVREQDTVITLISPKVTFLQGVILFYQMNPPLIDLNQSVNQLNQTYQTVTYRTAPHHQRY